MRKRELVDFIVSVLCLLLTVPLVGMQCVTVAFQGHTVDLLFRSNIRISKDMPMCYFFCSCFFICLFKIFCCCFNLFVHIILIANVGCGQS